MRSLGARPSTARRRRGAGRLRRAVVHLRRARPVLLFSPRRTVWSHGRADLACLKRDPMQLLLTIMFFAALGGIASAAFAVVFLWLREDHSALILPHLISF